MSLYQEWVQPVLFYGSVTISALLIYRGKNLISVFKALLPFLVYMVINFSIEAILFADWLSKLTVSREAFALLDINLSICDIKVVLAVIGVMFWYLVYNKIERGKKP